MSAGRDDSLLIFGRQAVLREWSGALERGDVELAAPRAATPERQLDLGLLVDDEVDAGHNAEQEVG
jgi:hypothetical protein